MTAAASQQAIVRREALLPAVIRRGDTMGMAAPLYYSADMVRELIDESRHWPRYETVYGELLVTPAPRPWHQIVATRLTSAIAKYLETTRGFQVFTSPADISWGPDILVQPDVFVVPIEEARTLAWPTIRTLVLAVEILSPSSGRADRFTKRRLYQDVGIPLYWIIDADAGVAEVWKPDDQFPRIERERLVWAPAGTALEFSIDLAALLRPL